jgi:hypothetical protein
MVMLRRELTAGETADLGTSQLHRGGRIEVRLKMADGSTVPGLPLRISSVESDQTLTMTLSPDGAASSGPAAPGEYGLLVWGESVGSAWIPVRIEDGDTTSIEAVIRPGARRVLRISVPDGASDEVIRVLVRTGDGKPAFDLRVHPDWGWKASPGESSRAVDLRAGFAPGTYTAEASGAGLRAQASFTVASLDETAPPILLDLH